MTPRKFLWQSSLCPPCSLAASSHARFGSEEATASGTLGVAEHEYSFVFMASPDVIPATVGPTRSNCSADRRRARGRREIAARCLRERLRSPGQFRAGPLYLLYARSERMRIRSSGHQAGRRSLWRPVSIADRFPRDPPHGRTATRGAVFAAMCWPMFTNAHVEDQTTSSRTKIRDRSFRSRFESFAAPPRAFAEPAGSPDGNSPALLRERPLPRTLAHPCSFHTSIVLLDSDVTHRPAAADVVIVTP